MPLRRSALLAATCLLAACSSPAPKSVTPTISAAKPAAPVVAPLPAHLRELSGSLAGAPAGSTVELALLVIDERDRPQRLLGNIELQGSGAVLPFRLSFNPEAFPQGARVELRGRVSQAGMLILQLPARRISTPTTQALGTLQLAPAP
ncbi:YbaY family lipoprotein [Pseudomonas sp. LS44]|uniref:YbaY family lipoprotein n=1 Tax=Pseudomonas sp. LS44 TaxID=1357074 RepID=UPI00215AEE64|nr:YbaY family lipoprotein [Pseudomonas sp. LS44]UVE17304.1 YbaY family lipoprotein [Pseudomonas sp. LS44]